MRAVEHLVHPQARQAREVRQGLVAAQGTGRQVHDRLEDGHRVAEGQGQVQARGVDPGAEVRRHRDGVETQT